MAHHSRHIANRIRTLVRNVSPMRGFRRVRRSTATHSIVRDSLRPHLQRSIGVRKILCTRLSLSISGTGEAKGRLSRIASFKISHERELSGDDSHVSCNPSMNLSKHSENESQDRSISKDDLCCISEKDVEIQSLLGSGGFSSVYSISTKHSALMNQNHKLALKRLHERTLSCSVDTFVAAQDMVNEAKLLVSLPVHPNIITIHAVSERFWEMPSTGFLILERLTTTLDKRIQDWQYEVCLKKLDSNPASQDFVEHEVDLLLSEQLERVTVAGVGVAKAIEHMHNNGILFRDLKPHNVGFDEEDNVRVFDFGLSKRLDDNEGRLLTCGVGTPRYMAPEVISTESYGYAADVYSYSILLWQIMTLKKPYANATCVDDLEDRILRGNRPSVKSVASPAAKLLLKASWHKKANKRPNMTSIIALLDEIFR